MRLLDTWNRQFVEKDLRHPETKYAILSHTLDHEGEQTYQELKEIQKRYTLGPKCQPPNNPRGVHSDPPSLADRHEDVALLTPSQSFLLLNLLLILLLLLPPHDALPTMPSAAQGASLSALFVSQPSHAQSSMTSMVPSPPNAPQDRSETPLSPIWDDPKLSPKIREACKVAHENGYWYIWIDSCCINKMSSSELSEASGIHPVHLAALISLIQPYSATPR